KNVICSDVYELDEKNFDTILLMGRAFGFVEDILGLQKFLEYCKFILNPNSQILLDSLDVRYTDDPGNLAYQERSRKLGRYIGVIRLQMEYKGILGEKFRLLHIDSQTLKECAEEIGWSFELIIQEETGSYLGKIFRENL
ncbi:MAG: hypothetical protein ACFFFH_21560, partial [Candidatus Thorarchaeota archaeon]